MLFNSWDFLLFFIAVFCLYICLAKRAQNAMLLLASYFFYGYWDYRFLTLIWISTAVDYAAARVIERTGGKKRKAALAASVVTNLGILATFKYFDFFALSFLDFLAVFGLEAHLPTLNVVLPVGISFYTFQSMGYTIDVYRGRVKARKDPLLFALYVAYFPQLVAGPIERARNLMPQLAGPRVITNDKLSSGALLVLVGLVRKVAIADVVAREVDIAFSRPGAMSGLMLARAAFLFSLQIYNDFAGYSDIARGISRMLGIEIMRNFEHPYFAADITMFWRRWHISFSTWLRDYLYIPLGGSRKGRARTYINLMVTMLLCGLWHGAAWHFVIWGGLHGFLLAIHRAWRRGRSTPMRPDIDSFTKLPRVFVSGVLTFLAVTALWVFFRAPDTMAAISFFVNLFEFKGGMGLRPLMLPVWVLALTLYIDLPQYLAGKHTAMLEWPWYLRGASYAGLILILALTRSETYEPFIYFKF